MDSTTTSTTSCQQINVYQPAGCHRCGAPLETKPRVFANGTTHLETRCAAGHFIEFTWQEKPLDVMPFGMHKGQPIKNLPPNYVRWLLRNAHVGRSLRAALEKVAV